LVKIEVGKKYRFRIDQYVENGSVYAILNGRVLSALKYESEHCGFNLRHHLFFVPCEYVVGKIKRMDDFNDENIPYSITLEDDDNLHFESEYLK
jgi:hypothetical protein